MKRAFIPVASMLAIQVMISLSVLSLGVMMPAVARDLAIDAKLVGVFTALIYAVAAGVAEYCAVSTVMVASSRSGDRVARFYDWNRQPRCHYHSSNQL